MRYVKQFSIIIMISFAGELLKELLPFSVPASIYGLVLMLLALMTGMIKVEQVNDVSTFLLDIMPIMFIPASVGLMESWHVMQSILIPAAILCIVGTPIVMVVSGRVTQNVINRLEKRKRIREENKEETIKIIKKNNKANSGDNIK
ncbi:MAG: CidA/LrgA family protein [Clostridium sp.]|nr:CidA/LrgA family protein [Clostridium sp.]MCM1173252.1 CidA/LrgA family protein [Clostridium sp.]MCM1208346.1 CidA/LrgA family protein [Ruminococcus sp.]